MVRRIRTTSSSKKKPEAASKAANKPSEAPEPIKDPEPSEEAQASEEPASPPAPSTPPDPDPATPEPDASAGDDVEPVSENSSADERQLRRLLFEELQRCDDELDQLEARRTELKLLRADIAKRVAVKYGLKKTWNWNGRLLQPRRLRDGSFTFRSISLGEAV